MAGDTQQDYDARFTKLLGATNTLTIDGYVDHYATDLNRQVASNFFRSHFFFTHGLLITDDLAGSKNDFGFGYSLEHQTITNSQFPDNFTSPGQVLNQIAYLQPFAINERGFFVNDQYTPNSRVSFFANLWIKHAGCHAYYIVRPSGFYHVPSDGRRRVADHGGSFGERAAAGFALRDALRQWQRWQFLSELRRRSAMGIGDVPDANLRPKKRPTLNLHMVIASGMITPFRSICTKRGSKARSLTATCRFQQLGTTPSRRKPFSSI